MGYKGEFFEFTDRHFLGENERKPQAHSLFSEMVKKISDTMDEEGEMFFNVFKPSPSTRCTHCGPDP